MNSLPGRVPCSCLAAVNQLGARSGRLWWRWGTWQTPCCAGEGLGDKNSLVPLLEAAAGFCPAPGSIFRFCKRRAGAAAFPAAFRSSAALPRARVAVGTAASGCSEPRDQHRRVPGRSSRSLAPARGVAVGIPPAPRGRWASSWTTRRWVLWQSRLRAPLSAPAWRCRLATAAGDKRWRLGGCWAPRSLWQGRGGFCGHLVIQELGLKSRFCAEHRSGAG